MNDVSARLDVINEQIQALKMNSEKHDRQLDALESTAPEVDVQVNETRVCMDH